MHIASRKKLVLLGMMTKMPVAGVVWQYVHYLVGFERLGFEVYYIEQHARTPSMFMATEEDDGSAKAAAFIAQMMERFDLGDRWAFQALHEDGARWLGMSAAQVRALFDSAEVIINMHGGTTPLPEHHATDRLVYLETDPVQLQIELHENLEHTVEFLDRHCAFFTFGENFGAADCGLPVTARYQFFPTRQPVLVDLWEPFRTGAAERFTTIGNWQQQWRSVSFMGELYTWSKHFEFLKFIDLPSRTRREFELALSSYSEADRQMLEGKGWKVRHGLEISMDLDLYRGYIASSRGEFTVAKDQNVRLRSGWFSDRSATYLAAGRPVITQETGFSNVLPTGAGLFGFSTMEEILGAIEAIDSDYERHSRAALEVARGFLNYDVVLQRLLEDLRIAPRLVRAPRPDRPRALPPKPRIPDELQLTPLSRRPLRLAEATVRSALAMPVPCVALGAPVPDWWKVSIVVVTRDGLIFNRLCLGSVLANTTYPNYEVIVVDNGSADGTAEFLRELAARNPHVRAIFNERNAGFAVASNQGLAAAGGDVLILLNNDTLVAPPWLGGLLQHLAKREIGLVGAVTNRIGNEAEIATDYGTYAAFIKLALERAKEHAGALFDIGMPAMFCLAMRRDAFEKIGPLDEQFEVGMFEDDDYAMRARAAGFRVVCAEDVFVHHFGEGSFGGLVPSGAYSQIFETNRRRFEQKWGVNWHPHGRRARAEYEALKDRVAALVRAHLPADARVLVVSKGDPDLLVLDGRAAAHFPQSAGGEYAGNHPADSASAIAELEGLRDGGAEFFVLTESTAWWLEHYRGFAEHLHECYPVVVREEGTAVIFSLVKAG